MSGARQPALPFGLPETERPRKEPWMKPATTQETRRVAHARQTAKRKEKMWERIVAYIREHGDATADEITAAWGCSPNSVAPRCCELLQLGRLETTGKRRRTRSGGMAAVLKIRA